MAELQKPIQHLRYIRFDPVCKLKGLAGRLPEFVALVGEERWRKRSDHLAAEAQRSPYRAKIVSDHHWVEMELSAQLMVLREHGRLLPEEVFVPSMAVLMFAAMVVDVHRRLSEAARVTLIGRLRDGLKTGFAGLYLELDFAQSLLNEGFEVMFPDLEGIGRHDLQFRRGVIEGDLECKSLSADAGRKIHRRDFYRFMDMLGPSLLERTRNRREVLIVTLDDRLLADDASQCSLRTAALELFAGASGNTSRGDFFMLEREPFEERFGEALKATRGDFHAACQQAYGSHCHVAGCVTEDGGYFVVVRSQREDDHSKPQLDALKAAASQLSSERPGIIAMQYQEIEPADLTLPHLRRRTALLDNVIFHTPEYTHVAAVYHCAYNGLHAAGQQIEKPAFVCWSPRWKGRTEGLPFRTGLHNSEFAHMLGVDPGNTDPDDYLYGTCT